MRAATGTQGNARQKRHRRGSRGSNGSIADDFGGLEGLLRSASFMQWLYGCVTLQSTPTTGMMKSIYALGIDKATRWFSWYIVMENVLRKKAQIIQFMTNHEVALGDNRLIASD
jgi:hypothetical protein